MPRDLFEETLATRRAPKRSRWTIAGSILLHVGLVCALLIIPVLSAFDSFVLRANNSLQFILPAVVVPETPPPPSNTAALAPNVRPDAAPLSPPEHPVTAEVNPPIPDGRLTVVGGTGSGGTPPGGTNDSFRLLAEPVPSATSVGPVRPGGDIKPPSRTLYVAPVYPAAAKSAHIEGTVILEATIDVNGQVRDLRVLRSVPFLDDAAKAAVSQWRYSPTKLNGIAVPVILTVTVTFEIRK